MVEKSSTIFTIAQLHHGGNLPLAKERKVMRASVDAFGTDFQDCSYIFLSTHSVRDCLPKISKHLSKKSHNKTNNYREPCVIPIKSD